MSDTLVGLLAAGKLVEEIGHESFNSGIETRGARVELWLNTSFYGSSFEEHYRSVAKISQLLTDSSTSSRYGSIHRRKTRFQQASEWHELSGKYEGASIVVNYLAPHEHESPRGDFHNGKVRWRCGSCREVINITECRKMGLLPKLDRSRKASVK